MNNLTLSFHEVLHADFVLLGHLSRMHELAMVLKYPYFLWNDRVYNTKDCTDTGLERKHVK